MAMLIMMAQRSKTTRKNLKYQSPTIPSAMMIAAENTTIKTKRTLESQLTSRSSVPVFCLGEDAFIAILVSIPVCTAMPRI